MRDQKTGSGGKFKCLLLIRVSTTKQVQTGESPEHQLRRGLVSAEQRFGASPDEVFVMNETWSGRAEDRPSLEQAFELARSCSIPHLLFFDIDRLTRAGPEQYERIKRRFKEIGCDIVDVKGIIQPAANSLEGSGGEFGPDFSYDWSVFSSSEKAEVMEAQMAKDEARKILGRTVPIMIDNVQKGRTTRPACYGYRNCKVIDDSGKPQPSMEVVEAEVFFVRRLFEGVAAGRDIRALCDDLNQRGFKSRTHKRWNTDHSVVVGTTGGNPLNPEQARRMLERPLYAGFNFEKWTYWRPVKAHHPAIVSVKMWNAANKSRWELKKTGQGPSEWERINLKTSTERRSYRRARPDFPFKALILCQECRKPMKASFSKGKYERFGYYHCARDHKRVAIRREALHNLLNATLSDLTFTPEIAVRFEDHIRAVWVEKVGALNRHLAGANQEVGHLRLEADAIFEKIKLANSPMIIERLEGEYEALEQRITQLEATREDTQFDERDANRVIKWARHMVEHLDELILDAEDEGLRGVFWSLIFSEPPTLEDIRNGTPRISPLVRLKGELSDEKSHLVARQRFGWNSLAQELFRWADRLAGMESAISGMMPLDPDIYAETLPQAA